MKYRGGPPFGTRLTKLHSAEVHSVIYKDNLSALERLRQRVSVQQKKSVNIYHRTVAWAAAAKNK